MFFINDIVINLKKPTKLKLDNLFYFITIKSKLFLFQNQYQIHK